MDSDEAKMLLLYALNEHRASEDAWHGLCIGTKTHEEVVAQRSGVESARELAHKLELFAPMTKRVRRETLGALLDRYYPSPSSTRVTDKKPPLVLKRKMQRGPKTSPYATVASVTIAAVAALVLVWFLQRSNRPPEMDPMPNFHLELEEGSFGEMRGANEELVPDACDVVYRPEQSLSARLSTPQSLAETLTLAIFASHAGKPAERLSLTAPRQSHDGVVTIKQPLAELGITRGNWVLTFYLARMADRPKLQGLRDLRPGTHPGVLVLERTICVR